MTQKAAISRRLADFAKETVGTEWGWQTRFAEMLGISPSNLNNLLTGRQVIGPGTRERLTAIGCDVEWLMSGNKKEGLSDDQGTSVGIEGTLNLPSIMPIPVIGKVLATPEGKQYFEDLPEGVSVPYFRGPYFALVIENYSLIHAP